MDVVADAYLGNIQSAQLVNDTRERIDWLVERIGPGSVLDIGRSQGILALLLGRRGDTNVMCIDILESAIQASRQALASESHLVKNAVDFAQVDFLSDDIRLFQGRFDTVVIGQVLEHIRDPAEFVSRAVSCLSAHGVILITVPYGVWDHHEHEETFFVHTLFDLLSPLVTVTRVEMVGGRLAMTGSLAPESRADAVTRQTIWDVEQQFFIRKERRHLDRIERLKSRTALLEKTNVRGAKPRHGPQSGPELMKTFLLTASTAAETLSRNRYMAKKEREKSVLLQPLRWLRLQLGLGLVRRFARAAQNPIKFKRAIKDYFFGPKRARFHRDDIDLFYAETVSLFLGLFEEHPGQKNADRDAVIRSAVQDIVAEPQASLFLLQVYQAHHDMDKAVLLCRDLLDGKSVN